MIEAIREIGEYSLRKDHIDTGDPQGLIKIFCEDIRGRAARPPRILTIELEKNGNQISFLRVSEEPFSKERNIRYLYRFGSSRGLNISPTSKVGEKGAAATFQSKISRWFPQGFLKVSKLLDKEDVELFDKIGNCIKDNHDPIINKLTELYKDIRTKKDSSIITLIILENQNRHYIGDLNAFKKAFISQVHVSLYQKYNQESRAKNQICSVCRKKTDEVYGFVSTYNFYTVDKPGMVSGGFDQSQAWKNYPVCFQCAKELEMGKKYLDNYSHFNFFQFDYFIIPKPLLIQERDKIFHILKTFHDEGGEKVQITEKYETLMSDTKDEILNLLSTQENSFICNILIYEENNNEFKIDKCIEDIFPSRLKDLFNAKRTVDNILIFKNLEITIFNEKKKPEKKLFTFNFGCIYHFFGKERDSNTRTYFLDIVEKIFSGRPISYSLILSGIIRKIRKSFYQNAKLKTPTKESALQGLALLVYLNELRILSELQRGLPMTSQFNNIILDGSSETHKKVEEIFKKFPAFFDTSAKCAIYLEGVLCQKLLNIQYSEREATPFRTKLQGLKLDQKKVQTLLPDIQNKLEEYKKNYYRDLEQLIAALTRDSGKDWNLSKDEISFFFVLGMNLADEFTFEKQHEVKTND